MLEKVISGGQIGADIAGLRAAKAVGLPTGGWMPKGFKTKHGDRPEYAEEYGIQEISSPNYALRTLFNVRHSDATFRFAINFESPGERCTLKAILKEEKPFLDFDCDKMEFWPELDRVVDWLEENDVKVLNIAGNAMPGMENAIIHYLMSVFEIAIERGKNDS